MKYLEKILLSLIFAFTLAPVAFADADYDAALRRAQYLLNGTTPTDADFANMGGTSDKYKSSIDYFLNHPNFYQVLLRYHERVFGVGLKDDYLDDLKMDDITSQQSKFAKIRCSHTGTGSSLRYHCEWSSTTRGSTSGNCPISYEQGVSVFWYPGVVAWVCPQIVKTCGSDLSRCFIESDDENEAKNSEVGATEVFDSKFAVIKSLSRQSAGLATAIAVANYPYTKILEPGVTAIDGAVAHLYRQGHHFELSKMNLPEMLMNIASTVSLNDTRFKIVNTGKSYESGGIISTFGWLRRYEKNRTRANQLYERLLCRKFTSALPTVFPQDPGNLRTTAGCSGCHSTLDPLADFFTTWGEGGDLYAGTKTATATAFGGKSGTYLSDLAEIIRNDNAFGTCQVEHAFEWMMGRKFYHSEADLRAALTAYFVSTNYSFKELLYSIATHPAFIEGKRGDGVVGDPLEQPPLGEPPGGVASRPCPTSTTYAADVQPKISQCTTCHFTGSASRQALDTEASWTTWGSQAVNMMASGNMPPGQAGPPTIGAVYDLKEATRCWLGIK